MVKNPIPDKFISGLEWKGCSWVIDWFNAPNPEVHAVGARTNVYLTAFSMHSYAKGSGSNFITHFEHSDSEHF